MHASVACVYAHLVYAVPKGQKRPEEAVGNPGTRVTDCCELQCECWGLNSDLLHHGALSQAPHATFFFFWISFLLEGYLSLVVSRKGLPFSSSSHLLAKITSLACTETDTVHIQTHKYTDHAQRENSSRPLGSSAALFYQGEQLNPRHIKWLTHGHAVS